MESPRRRRRGPRPVWVWLSSFGVFVALFGFEAVRMSNGHDPVINSTSSSNSSSTQPSTAQPSTTPQRGTQSPDSGSSQDYTPSSPPSTGSS
ncbi:MAG: hypothetical protein ACJ76V_07620 [Thermoleophilaceae bacterium]